MGKIVYTKDKVDSIIELHKSGKSPFEIAKLFGTYNTTIRRILLKNNIKLKDHSEAHASVAKNPFEDYQTNELAAYWLGYLIADGCVSEGKGGYRVIINTNKDPEHLQKYADFIGRPLKKYWNKTYEVWEYSVSFCNKKIVQWLIELGITPKKSLTFEFKGDFNNHLVRGIFDGDGYMGNSYLSITTGSKHFANQLFSIFEKEGGEPSIYLDKRRNGSFNVVAKSFINIDLWMVKNATIFLHRKHGQLVGNI